MQGQCSSLEPGNKDILVALGHSLHSDMYPDKMSWSSSINSDCSLHEVLVRPCKEVTV